MADEFPDLTAGVKKAVEEAGRDPAPKMTAEACLEAMSRTPVRMALSWEELRRVTREP